MEAVPSLASSQTQLQRSHWNADAPTDMHCPHTSGSALFRLIALQSTCCLALSEGALGLEAPRVPEGSNWGAVFACCGDHRQLRRRVEAEGAAALASGHMCDSARVKYRLRGTCGSKHPPRKMKHLTIIRVRTTNLSLGPLFSEAGSSRKISQVRICYHSGGPRHQRHHRRRRRRRVLRRGYGIEKLSRCDSR